MKANHAIEIGSCEMIGENGVANHFDYILVPFDLALAFRDFAWTQAVKPLVTWSATTSDAQLMLFPSDSQRDVRRLRNLFEALAPVAVRS